MTLADRLRGRGVDNPGSFLSWAIGAGHHGPLDGIFDRDLDVLVREYRQAIGLSAPRRRMDPATAHRMVEEGAQRHRDRLAVEQVVRQVLRRAARAARSQHPYCLTCTPTVPCYKHEGDWLAWPATSSRSRQLAMW